MGPNDPRLPDGETLVRLQSISKLFASSLLASLAAEGRVKLTDPLQRYAPGGARVPQAPDAPPITLLNLATHTAGLSRNLPTGEDELSETAADRWAWLTRQRRLPPPGRFAHYSNYGFDLLGDALAASAGEPYGEALRRNVVARFGLRDTTAQPTADQCRRMMASDPRRRDWPCVDQSSEAASGGLYSTADDMARWLSAQLDPAPLDPMRRISQGVFFRREALRSVQGLDHAGTADALGLGWVMQAPSDSHPAILEKTGGGDGFLTYVVMAPDQHVGLFVAFNNESGHRLRPVADQANNLVAALASKEAAH
jgi:D-alanyl-D-alanine-carboxypeptidase/D-alanyl-D-alanine-endopeptidase